MKNANVLIVSTLAQVGHTGAIRYQLCVVNKHMLRGKKIVNVSPVNVPNVSCHSIYWMSRDRRRASRNFMYLLFFFPFSLVNNTQTSNVCSRNRKWNTIQITYQKGRGWKQMRHTHIGSMTKNIESNSQYTANAQFSGKFRCCLLCGAFLLRYLHLKLEFIRFYETNNSNLIRESFILCEVIQRNQFAWKSEYLNRKLSFAIFGDNYPISFYLYENTQEINRNATK